MLREQLMILNSPRRSSSIEEERTVRIIGLWNYVWQLYLDNSYNGVYDWIDFGVGLI